MSRAPRVTGPDLISALERSGFAQWFESKAVTTFSATMTAEAP
jgi:hypothetical protein